MSIKCLIINIGSVNVLLIKRGDTFNPKDVSPSNRTRIMSTTTPYYKLFSIICFLHMMDEKGPYTKQCEIIINLIRLLTPWLHSSGFLCAP